MTSEERIKEGKKENGHVEPTHYFRGYLNFWVGQILSLLGSNVVNFALIWWLTVKTGSPFVLGLAVFMGMGPRLFVTLFAGVYVDRWSRKKVITVADTAQALLSLFLVVAFLMGYAEVWLILVVVALGGVAGAFHGPAVQAIIPLMVPQEHLSRVNGWTYLANSLIMIIGPPVGALLLLFFDINQILWIDSITYVFAIIPVLLIRIPAIKTKKKEGRSFRADFGEGVTFIRDTPGLLSLLSAFTVTNALLSPLFMGLLPVLVTNVHKGRADDLAFIMALLNVGMLGGGVLMSTWKGFNRKAFGVLVSMFMFTGAMLVVPLAKGTNWSVVMGVALLVFGFFLPVGNISSQTIWQQVVPPEKLGRVFSVRLVLAQGVTPFATLLLGGLAEVVGVLPIFIVNAALQLVFLTYLTLFTKFIDLDDRILGRTEGGEVSHMTPLDDQKSSTEEKKTPSA